MRKSCLPCLPSENVILVRPKTCLTQKPLKGYFASHATRYTKSRVFIRRKAYHPLWWNVVNSSFLQANWIAAVIAAICPARPTKRRLPLLRYGFGFDICDHHGVTADQQNRGSSVQRKLSGAVGAGAFPGSNDPATIFPATATPKGLLKNKLYNLGNVAQPPPAVYRGKPQPGAAVPHIKLVNVIYFQALIARVDLCGGG